MKRIGIITMHRVVNVGSILQAYALCEKLNQLGADAEIIDYQYPNDFHSRRNETHSVVRQILLFPQRIKYFLLYKKTLQKSRFNSFFCRWMRLSKYYPSQNSLYTDVPKYDVYLTGSDQVWNPNCMKGDGVFFFDFVQDGDKASYAASFSIMSIPQTLKQTYSTFLKEYKYIGVREINAIDIVRDLVGITPVVVCDPTLLLTKDDYTLLAYDSKLKKSRDRYILVYALTYAYNPYPQIERVIEAVRRKLGYKVRYLHANSVEHYHLGKSITSAGPAEFIDLFLNASFVITSSFHGTAFAVNFEIPFISIIPDKQKDDGRILSLLSIVGLAHRAITTTQRLPEEISVNVDFEQSRRKLERYRTESESFLRQVLA